MELPTKLIDLRNNLLRIPSYAEYYELCKERNTIPNFLKDLEGYGVPKKAYYFILDQSAPTDEGRGVVVIYALENPELFFDSPEQALEEISKNAEFDAIAASAAKFQPKE